MRGQTHHPRGRLRLRFSELRRHPLRLGRVCDELRTIEGIQLIEASQLNGAMLIHYDARQARGPGNNRWPSRCGFPAAMRRPGPAANLSAGVAAGRARRTRSARVGPRSRLSSVASATTAAAGCASCLTAPREQPRTAPSAANPCPRPAMPPNDRLSRRRGALRSP